MSGTFLWSNVYFTLIISCWFSLWVFYQLLKVGYWNILLLVYCSLCLLSGCCLVTRSCPILGDPMGCSTPGLAVLHYLLEFAQTHVRWVGVALQLSHPLSPPSPPALNLSYHWGLFQWVGSLHQVAKVLEFQLQHQSFQWIFRVDFL